MGAEFFRLRASAKTIASFAFKTGVHSCTERRVRLVAK